MSSSSSRYDFENKNSSKVSRLFLYWLKSSMLNLLSLEVETERKESSEVHIFLLSFLSPINGEKKVKKYEPIRAYEVLVLKIKVKI